MNRKLALGIMVLLAVAITSIAPAMAADTKATTGTHKEGAKTMGHRMAANEVAVCACGKVFVPTAETKYITVNGKQYACCSDDCHKKGMADPTASAKAADDNTAKLLGAAPAAAPAEPSKQ